MSDPEFTVEKQRPANWFKPGQSGNPAGRPRGSRTRLGEDFLADLATAWQTHGASALARCAEEEPAQFVRVVAGLLPRDLNLNIAVDAAAFAAQFKSAQALLGNPEPGRQRRALPGEPVVIDHDD